MTIYTNLCDKCGKTFFTCLKFRSVCTPCNMRGLTRTGEVKKKR